VCSPICAILCSPVCVILCSSACVIPLVFNAEFYFKTTFIGKEKEANPVAGFVQCVKFLGA
jgi:hypothetical protein